MEANQANLQDLCLYTLLSDILFVMIPMLLEGLQGCTEIQRQSRIFLSLKDVETTLSQPAIGFERTPEGPATLKRPKLRIATREPPLSYGSIKVSAFVQGSGGEKLWERRDFYPPGRRSTRRCSLFCRQTVHIPLFSTHYGTHCVHCTVRLADEFVTCTNCSKVKFVAKNA